MFENMFTPEAFENFKIALQMMGKGMLGVFVVIGIIALIVYIMTKISSSKAKNAIENSEVEK